MKAKARFSSVGLFVLAIAALQSFSASAGYHLERISPVLNQPTFLTQRPGDPPNLLFYTTRIGTAFSGFSSVNTMGGVWKYDVNSRTSFQVLSLSSRQVYNDDGLQTVAFHPDYTNALTPGYGKMYVSSAEYTGSPAVNRVEE